MITNIMFVIHVELCNILTYSNLPLYILFHSYSSYLPVGDPDMDEWCEVNCAAGSCPDTHCICISKVRHRLNKILGQLAMKMCPVLRNY